MKPFTNIFQVLLLVAILWLPGCADDEARAQKDYDAAMAKVEAEALEEAIELFETLDRTYPDTQVARRARSQLVLFRGLGEAVESYPWETARELMVTTARALDQFRSRNRSWPRNLDALRPKWLSESPIDPWGRPLQYRKTQRGYILICHGADGRVGGDGDAADLSVENGRFVRKPSETF
ncbi:MAG: type II secretion system protein GspG [Acidobacteriota bacterium]|nr:type II secretion system protein GspG [Acidobacteriota bacterium]MDH3784773.1 type II secretion system protein GspG [Acidobacteriota bacterium]